MRNRHSVPCAPSHRCPRCGTTIEAVYFAEHQTNCCPSWQTVGRVLKDRRLSRLLK